MIPVLDFNNSTKILRVNELRTDLSFSSLSATELMEDPSVICIPTSLLALGDNKKYNIKRKRKPVIKIIFNNQFLLFFCLLFSLSVGGINNYIGRLDGGLAILDSTLLKLGASETIPGK